MRKPGSKVIHRHTAACIDLIFFFTSTMHGIEERPVVAVKQLIYYCIVTEYQKSLCQLKNAGSILEYEKMAEIGFEKRDFRMVSYTVVTI